MKPDPKPNLGPEGIRANVEHYRCLRIQAHAEYLRVKRQERYWREQLHQLASDSA